MTHASCMMFSRSAQPSVAALDVRKVLTEGKHRPPALGDVQPTGSTGVVLQWSREWLS